MNNTKVSLILPIYNVGNFFDECMQSVIHQSHQNLEIILVDDGSTDNSGSKADEYAKIDDRIIVIHQKNSGVSTARNVGIDHATGDYVCFSDPDDILKPDYVSYMLSLCLHYNCDIAVCAEVFTTFMPDQRKDNIAIVSGEEAAAQILYGKITIGCYSKMYNRRFLNDNKLRFFPNVYIGEGFNFNTHSFCTAKRVAISQHKVYYYRLEVSSSAMNKFNIDKCQMGINAIEIIRKNLRIKTKRLYKAVDYAEWFTYGSMYDWMVMANVKTKYPEMYKRCLKVTRYKAFPAIFAPTTTRMKFVAISRVLHPFIWAYARVVARMIASWKERA